MTTQQPTHREILAHLVALRASARYLVSSQQVLKRTIEMRESLLTAAIQAGHERDAAVCKIDLAEANDRALEVRFQIIETGNAFIGASHFYDQLPRPVWLRAFCVNEAHWHTPDMVKYGDCVRNVISVLNLENSATSADSIVNRPLHWCCTAAMFHMSDTNPALGRTLHEAANEIFAGAFGTYQAPTDLQRMGVR